MQTKARKTLPASSVDVCSPYNLDPSDLRASPEEEERMNASDPPWEERYEKIWVESEKKETKSQYKNVTAELKERFGELETGDLLEKDEEDGKEAKGDKEVDTSEEEEADVEDSSEDEDEPIVRPTARARSAILLPIPEQRESGLEDSQYEEPPEGVQRAVSVEISDDLHQDNLSNDLHHPTISRNNRVDCSSYDDDDGDLSAGSGTKAKVKKCPSKSENIDEKADECIRTQTLDAIEPDVPPNIQNMPPSDSDEVEEGLWKSRYEVGHQSGTSLQ